MHKFDENIKKILETPYGHLPKLKAELEKYPEGYRKLLGIRASWLKWQRVIESRQGEELTCGICAYMTLLNVSSGYFYDCHKCFAQVPCLQAQLCEISNQEAFQIVHCMYMAEHRRLFGDV